MTYTKEQLAEAFTIVMLEQVPDLSDIPDHVFSERFEKKMNKLIAREAAHPWAIRHPVVKNLIAAVLVIILLFALSMSVGAVRDKVLNFFREHFDTYDYLIFSIEDKKQIEQLYEITAIPEGFTKTSETNSKTTYIAIFENAAEDYILFEQKINSSQGYSIDNEHLRYRDLEIDGQGIFAAEGENEITLIWSRDDYVFCLVESWPGVTLDSAINAFHSISARSE